MKLKKGEVHSEKAAVDDSVSKMDGQKRAVTLLSTLHDDTMVDVQRRSRGARGGVESIQKPKMMNTTNMWTYQTSWYCTMDTSIAKSSGGNGLFSHLIDLNSNLMYNSVTTTHPNGFQNCCGKRAPGRTYSATGTAL